MDNKDIMEELLLIIADIKERQTSDNCKSVLTWNELCDMGSDLFKHLKNQNK